MTGLYSVIVPEAGTNLILNPSAETTGNFGNHNSGTASRITTYARFGDYCYQVATGAIDRGMTLTVAALTNAIHYFTFYARGNAANTLQVSADASTYNAVTAIGGATGGWVRYGVSLPAAQCNGSTSIIIRDTVSETFYVDGAMLQLLAYATTYIDGDQGSLYKWTGLRHGSTSTRDAQDRSGGREMDFDTDYGIQVAESSTGQGMPPQSLNVLAQALLAGGAFQSSKDQTRRLDLRLRIPGASLANLHARRQDLIDLLKSTRVRGNQPVVIGYSGSLSGTKVYGAFRYAGGLEFTTPLGATETPSVRLVAVDPYWYEDNRETASLDFQDSISSSAYANRRENGQWLALGSGFNSSVLAIKVDEQRGRIYFAGSFTTANGVTVNRICYWNGTTFVAMDGGTNGTVSGIAIAANGDVWICGSFTTVGSGAAATKGLARWNLSAGTWTAFNESTGSFAAVNSIAIDSTGKVYIGGEFTNWEGDAASDYMASTSNNGTDWDALGTVPFTASFYPRFFNELAVDANNILYVGGANTGVGTGALYKWDGSSWTAVGATDSASLNGVRAIHITPDGLIYVGGQFTTIGGVTAANIAIYNGTTFSPLGAGVSGGDVYSIASSGDGLIYVTGTFTSAGGNTLSDYLAAWNGYTWVQLDIDLPSVSLVYVTRPRGGDLFVGYTTSGTATAAGLTTVSPTATALVYPEVTLIGPSTADTSCTLQWLENQSRAERQYFNLTVLAGETVHMSTDPRAPSVVSDWRGQVVNNPLQASDGFGLLPEPATNTVAAFITGTTTGVSLLLHWQPRHLSIDGPA